MLKGLRMIVLPNLSRDVTSPPPSLTWCGLSSFLKLCLSCMPCPPPARTLTKTRRGMTPGAIMDGFTVGSKITATGRRTFFALSSFLCYLSYKVNRFFVVLTRRSYLRARCRSWWATMYSSHSKTAWYTISGLSRVTCIRISIKRFTCSVKMVELA